MPFTVSDFHDLVELLEAHPQWRAELRRLVLTEEMLALPRLVQELAAAQQRTEQRVEELAAQVRELAAAQQRLAEAQARTEARVEELAAQVRELAAAQARTEQRVEELAAQVRELAAAQQRLAEAQARTEARVEELAAAQARTEQRVEELAAQVRELAAAQARTEAQVRELAAAQARTEQRVEELAAQVRELAAAQQRLAEAQARTERELRRIVPIVGRLQGSDKERFYRERAAAIFGILLDKGRDATPLVVQTIRRAISEGRLTREAGKDILLADLFWSGEFGERTVILVGEVAWTVDQDDVTRAVRRAEWLRQVGLEAVPFVGGEEWEQGVQDLAHSLGVVTAVDGQLDDAAWEAVLSRRKEGD